MKIEQIETLPLAARIEKRIRISTTTFTEARALIVRVTTDDGLTGIGESLVSYLVDGMSPCSPTPQP